ncbi:MAG: CPXCG motif-containing cysteine-rich protein [Ardenticatenales bacterium]
MGRKDIDSALDDAFEDDDPLEDNGDEDDEDFDDDELDDDDRDDVLDDEGSFDEDDDSGSDEDDLDSLDSLDDLEQEVFFRCPWCAATVSALVELSDAAQNYIEDCEVCCRPMTLHVWRSGRRVRVEALAGG